MSNLIHIAELLSAPICAEPSVISMVMSALDNRITNGKVPQGFETSGTPIEIGEYNGIGLMKISGTLVPRNSMNAMCGESLVSVNDATLKFNDLASKYDQILLQVDSGGGSITGVPEFANAIRNSKAKVTGFTDTVAASGGAWILCACDEVVATPSARIGSIGVYIPVMKNKENPFGEVTYFSAGAKKLYGARDVDMSQAESVHFQSQVDSAYEWFTSAIAEFRGVSVEEVINTEAEVFSGKDAGFLVDRLVNNIMEV